MRIAVLDTGSSANALLFYIPDMETHPKGCVDFIYDSEDFMDSDGHGTHVGSLVSRMAPKADLDVARVSKTRNFQGSNESIVQAIIWASEQKADIVVLAFGFSEK